MLVNEAETIVDYLVKSLKTSNALTHSDILRALSTVLYENGCKASKVICYFLSIVIYLLGIYSLMKLLYFKSL